MPIEDTSYEVITLFPFSGLQGFQPKNHIYRAKSGREKEGSIKNETIIMTTIEDAHARFANAVIEVSGSHTICADCMQRDHELNG